MRAMQLVTLNEPLALQEVEKPTPGKGEVLVEIETCGLNFGDLLIIKGTYQEKPPLPYTLGMELAGTIRAVGDGVTHLKEGQRIAAFTGFGGLGEFAAVPAAVCVPIPDQMTAVVLDSYSGAEALRVEQRPVPKPEKDEVLVKVAASPINPSDLAFLSGNYGFNNPPPVVPGGEGSGTVVAAGPGAWRPGCQHARGPPLAALPDSYERTGQKHREVQCGVIRTVNRHLEYLADDSYHHDRADGDPAGENVMKTVGCSAADGYVQ